MGSINIIKAVSVCMSAVSIAAYIKVRQCRFNNKKKPLMQPNEEEDDNDLRHNLIKPRINFVNRIPRDLIELILSKVDDIVTLYSCSIVSREWYDIVTGMRVLCITMPRSLISYPKAAPPYFAVIHSRFPKGLVEREVDRCMLSMNQKISCDFFTRFSLLKSVVVQLPPPPTPDSNSKTCWFRWDSQINVTSHISSYYFISVDATIVDKNNNNQSSALDRWPVRGKEIKRRGYVAWRHLKLHANTVLTHFPSMKINPTVKAIYHQPMLRTIVSKDDNPNSKGRLTLYKINEEDVDLDELLLYKLEYRCKMCYLYNELELKSSGVTIKDAWLWFYYYDKDREDDNDGDDDFISIKLHEDDLIMSCLNKGDYSRDELKEAVAKILGHINTFHFSRPDLE